MGPPAQKAPGAQAAGKTAMPVKVAVAVAVATSVAVAAVAPRGEPLAVVVRARAS